MATAQAIAPRAGSSEKQATASGFDSLKDWAVSAFNKFNNDWTMNLVAMVSYNVLTSFFPLLLALITILAYIPAAMGSTADLANQINLILPSEVRKNINVASLIKNVNNQAGLLSLVSLVGLLWSGTNLFGSIESAFAIIYRVKTRDIIPQKLMCLVMILLFVILLPLSFVSAFILSSASTTLGRILPAALTGTFAPILAIASSFAALFVLFLAIYTVIPNVPVPWRDAWRGALVGAIGMTLVNNLFTVYTSHFVSTKQYSGAFIGGAIIAITWFWLFSLIMLVGAQINSLRMGIGPWPFDITRVLMDYKIPAEEGAASAMQTQPRKQHRALPFSGIARDSQNVRDVVPQAGKVQSKGNAGDKDKDKKHDADRVADPTVAVSSPGQAASAARAETSDKRGGSRLPIPFRKRDDAQQSSKDDSPHPAHEMPSNLVATGIESGGVRMATPQAVFGDPKGPPRGLLIFGAAVGLLSTLLSLGRPKEK